jgi:hypothetical protein
MDGSIRSELEFTIDATWTRKGRGVVGSWITIGGGRAVFGYDSEPGPDDLFYAALRWAEHIQKEAHSVGPIILRIPAGPESGLHALTRRDKYRGYMNRRTGLPYSSFCNLLRGLEDRGTLRIIREAEFEPVLHGYLRAVADASHALLPSHPKPTTPDQREAVLSKVDGAVGLNVIGAFIAARYLNPSPLVH